MRDYLLKMLQEDYPKGFFLMYIDNDGHPKLTADVRDIANHPLRGYLLTLLNKNTELRRKHDNNRD